MTARDFAVAAATAVFFLASIGTANISESINVALPAQYGMVFDQTPSLTGEVEAERRPVRLLIEKPERPETAMGPFARITPRYAPTRG